MPDPERAVHLSAEVRESLREARRRLHDLLPEFDRAERCGLNCKAFRAQAKKFSEIAEALEREYPATPGFD